ncbi:hypothetical protein MMC25_004372 [Agyrium rufum]|nr:hypothetical protein [Agyrium rufum]
MPYLLPLLGHTIEFGLSPGRRIPRYHKIAGSQALHGLRIINMNFYFIYKPENIAKLWRYKTTITTPNVTAFALKTLFAMAPKVLWMYLKDDSGVLSVPNPNSHIEPHNRIDYLTHANFHTHFLGDGLSDFFHRFAVSVLCRIPSHGVQDEWIEHDDIMGFWLPPLTASLNEALAGPLLEQISPDFTKGLLEYFLYTAGMFKGLPRWWILRAYRPREKLIRDVKTWHAMATKKSQNVEDNDGKDSDRW